MKLPTKNLLLSIIITSFVFISCGNPNNTESTNPVNSDTPTGITVQDTGIYKALTSLGFDISTEKFEAVDGQYQPKTSDITALSYRRVDSADKIGYNYILDRENSTENNLVYKGKIIDEYNNITYDTENNTIVVNNKEKSVEIYDSITNSYLKFTLNNDGTLLFMGSDTGQMTIKDNKIYNISGEEVYADIKIKLAE